MNTSLVEFSADISPVAKVGVVIRRGDVVVERGAKPLIPAAPTILIRSRREMGPVMSGSFGWRRLGRFVIEYG
jgi:hypothetical protein